MIFYFSGTGNSKYVATRLAAATGEQAVSMVRCMREGTFAFHLAPGERIGIVSPVYFWGLPAVVCRFVARLRLPQAEAHYAYGVLTFGTTAGQAHAQLRSALACRGIRLDGRLGIRMVDTWTPLFNLTDTAKTARCTEAAERRLKRVAERVTARMAGRFGYWPVPVVLARLYYRSYDRARTTRHFYMMANRCIGCGQCARQCPVGAIEMQSGRPVWIKARCELCLSCLHRCPRFAIQYGRHTAAHGQYVHPRSGLTAW